MYAIVSLQNAQQGVELEFVDISHDYKMQLLCYILEVLNLCLRQYPQFGLSNWGFHLVNFTELFDVGHSDRAPWSDDKLFCPSTLAQIRVTIFNLPIETKVRLLPDYS